jgi:hypothetical protein
MNLNKLKWTKNVNHSDIEWAYQDINLNSKIFYLHWTSDSCDNARKPQEEDLIIIRQRSKVTHIVEILNNAVYGEKSENPWISRLVKAIWMAEFWSEPPNQDEIFGYKINYPSGKAIYLENSNKFNQYWDNKGGISAFQERIKRKLKL